MSNRYPRQNEFFLVWLSLIAPRIMRAMAAPVLSHLDPDLVTLLDDVRTRLARTFKAPEGSLTIALSGTGTSGMEAMVANLVGDGRASS